MEWVIQYVTVKLLVWYSIWVDINFCFVVYYGMTQWRKITESVNYSTYQTVYPKMSRDEVHCIQVACIRSVSCSLLLPKRSSSLQTEFAVSILLVIVYFIYYHQYNFCMKLSTLRSGEDCWYVNSFAQLLSNMQRDIYQGSNGTMLLTCDVFVN
jgi:hypothetical protein